MTVNVFAVPIFFVIFRETLETMIIISVLLAFLKQTLDGPNQDVVMYRRLCKQVWYGAGSGLLVCMAVAGIMIGLFYGLKKDGWGKIEYYWEGALGIFAALVISWMGAVLLRVSKMQEKWRAKISKALEDKPVSTNVNGGRFKRWCEKYALFILPFITVLREGVEAIVFVGGVIFQAPATAIPLPVVVGLAAGLAVGYLLYKGGASSKIQLFLVVSTCLLYLVAAGLFSRGVWYLQAQQWNNEIGKDAAELGSGHGSYDIGQSVWHVNFGNPELNGGGGWGIFNGILGWQNSATYGSVISYNLYWVAVMIGFALMRYKEVTGHWPLWKAKVADKSNNERISGSQSGGSSGVFLRLEYEAKEAKEAEKTVEAVHTIVVPTRTIPI